jgi:hypothetical protein
MGRTDSRSFSRQPVEAAVEKLSVSVMGVIDSDYFCRTLWRF